MLSSNKTTNDKTYRNYPINNGNKKEYECYTKTLDQVIDQVEYISANHSKSLFTRLDIRNDGELNNKIQRDDMTRICENIKRAIGRKYKASPNKPDLTITWTTEKDGVNPHYHCLIGVNGNAIQNGYSIKEIVNKIVKKHLKTDKDGLVEFCKSNGRYGKIVDRNSSEFRKQLDDVIYAGSYLAKTNTKESRPKGARVSSTSRLPNDWKNTAEYENFIELKNRQVIDGINQNEDNNYPINDDDHCSNDEKYIEQKFQGFESDEDWEQYYSELRKEREEEKKIRMIDGPDFLPKELKERLAREGKVIRTRFDI